MSFNDENMVPLQEDLTQELYLLDIVRGLEGLIREDKKIAEGEVFGEGDWAVINNNGELEAPAATPVANTVPVWCGNGEGRSDVHATGKATILRSGRFIYRTTKFDLAPAYNVGDNLTVKDLGAGERVPTIASGTDPVLARVSAIPANGILEVEVL